LRTATAVATATTDPATPWDDRSPATVLKRVALGTSLAFAVPMLHPHWEALNLTNATKNVDPVARYGHFEKYYQVGDLDPAFPVLTAWELSHTVDADAIDEDLLWLRTSIGNYRPDLIAMTYHWRYVETVHTDVAYGDSQCSTFPGVCTVLVRDALLRVCARGCTIRPHTWSCSEVNSSRQASQLQIVCYGHLTKVTVHHHAAQYDRSTGLCSNHELCRRNSHINTATHH
jgi:hypothetical protein